MHVYTKSFAFLFISNFLIVNQAQKFSEGLPITVKDVGIAELKKNDVAMIFYVTVSNTAHEPVQLYINGTRCCQRITKEDQDCESMKLIGGDMGQLYPQDSRNLTLLYVNLYPHDRVGTCDVIITDDKKGSMTQTIKFNTTLVKGKLHVPRLIETYYEPDLLLTCSSIDKDPLNQCQPYICDNRYDGIRSLYNHTTERCEKIEYCVPTSSREDDSVAYDMQTGTCKNLITSMTEHDFAEFREGKPSIYTLLHEHGYPINVRCHNGKMDERGHWCECDEGWSSSPFDNKFFNPDIQVYHMCTVWEGEMDAEQAKNITVMPKSHHRRTNISVFTFLGISFVFLLPVLAYLLYKLSLARKLHKADALDQSETAKLTQSAYDTE